MKLFKKKDDPIRDRVKNDPIIKALVFIKLLIVFLPIVIIFSYVSAIALNEKALVLSDSAEDSLVTGYVTYKPPKQNDKVEFVPETPEQYQFRALPLDSEFYGYELIGLRDFFYISDPQNTGSSQYDPMAYTYGVPFEKKLVMLFDDGVLMEDHKGTVIEKSFDQSFNFISDSTIVYYNDKPAFFVIDREAKIGLLFDALGNQIWSVSMPDSMKLDDPEIIIQSVTSSVLGFLILVINPEDKLLFGITEQGEIAFETVIALGNISFDPDSSLQFFSSNLKDNADPAFTIVQSKFNLPESIDANGPFIKLPKLDWESGNLGNFGIEHRLFLVNEVTGKVFDAGKNINNYALSNALSSNLSFNSDIPYTRNDGSFFYSSNVYNRNYFFDNSESTMVNGFLQRYDLTNDQYHYVQKVSELRQMSGDYHQSTRIKILDFDMNAPDFTYSQYQKSFSDFLLPPNHVNKFSVQDNLWRIGPYLYEFDKIFDEDGAQFNPDKIEKIRMSDSISGFIFSMIHDGKFITVFRARHKPKIAKESE